MPLIAIGGDAATTTTLALAAAWPDRPTDEFEDLADPSADLSANPSANPSADLSADLYADLSADLSAGSAGNPTPGDTSSDMVVNDTARNDTARSDLVVVEADASGGSLAAWLDTPLSPSLSALVSSLHQASGTGSTSATMWKTIDSMIRRSTSGIRFVPAPFRSREARGAINEADRTLFPLLAASVRMVGLVDVGRLDPLRLPSTTRHADLVIVVHRQETASAPAATVRLERLAETVDALRTTGHEVALAVVGDEPFPLEEVVAFAAPGARAWSLAVDDLAAQVFAGRSGVSAKRLARLPLLRSATRAAADIAAMTDHVPPGAPAPSRAQAPAATTASPPAQREVAR